MKKPKRYFIESSKTLEELHDEMMALMKKKVDNANEVLDDVVTTTINVLEISIIDLK